MISVIVPAFNEGSGVKVAYQQIKEEFALHNEPYEVIFVDDGSTDETFDYIKDIAESDPHVKGVKFANNKGSHMAIRCGLSYASGDCACFIACDMQEPPELVFELKKKLTSPVKIVWAVRNSRKDNRVAIFFAKVFYFLARRIVSKNIPPSGASMFLISKEVLNAIRLYNEKNLTLEGLFATLGFQGDFLYYERQERMFGKSKWTLQKKLKLFVDFFVAYSYVPIRFVSLMGIFLSIIGFLFGIYIVVRQLVYGDLNIGWPATITVVLFGFGVTNISLGIVAEYLWRTLDETRGRPNYIIEAKINL